MPSENEIEPAPAVGAKVGVPQLFVEYVAGLATVIAPGLVGKVSVKLAPLMATSFGLLSVKVNVDVPVTLVGSGTKFLSIVISEGSTITAIRPATEKSLL